MAPESKTSGHTDGPLAAGAGVNGTSAVVPDMTPAPVSDSLAELRVARLRSFRSPRVEELEELEFLVDYLARRNRREAAA